MPRAPPRCLFRYTFGERNRDQRNLLTTCQKRSYSQQTDQTIRLHQGRHGGLNANLIKVVRLPSGSLSLHTLNVSNVRLVLFSPVSAILSIFAYHLRAFN